MNAALKKINARVKQLQKKHPGSKRVTLQKQAGKEYRAGKLKAVRKKSAPRKKRRVSGKVAGIGTRYKVAKRVGTKKPMRTAKRRASKPKVRVVTRIRTRTVVKRRSVGRTGGMKSIIPIVAIVGIGIAAYLLLRPKSSTVVVPGVALPLALTGNAQRDTASQNILSYAQAAGTTASALASLISALNGMNDASVVDVAQKQQSGMDINTLLALPQGGPSIHLG